MPRYRSRDSYRFSRWLLAAGLSLPFAGCAGSGAIEPAPEPAVPAARPAARTGEMERQAARIRELQEQVAQLQLGLMAKDAQVAELEAKLDEAIQEVVRAKAKLQSVESRAEAASALAEAEVALKAVRGAAGDDPGPETIQAEQLLEMSATEFDNENFGGSLYLASQAMSLVRIGQARYSGDAGPRQAGEVLFAIPLRLEVMRNSNVRAGPGTEFNVLFTLREGAPLIGLAYKAQWIRVRRDDGGGGWIFQSLVRSRRAPRP
jgi:hypothetical protein